MTLTVKGGRLSTPQTRPSRGPNGLHKPPFTPDYTTAATRTASTFAQLQTQFSAASSGEVIEVTADILGAAVTLTGGNVNWPTNVLIRPPLGQRRKIQSILVDAKNVTLAGFDVDIASSYTSSNRVFLWRIVALDGVGGSYNNEGGLVECVVPRARRLVESDTSQSLSVSGVNLVRPIVIGCWMAPASLPVGSLAHLDTLQIEGISGGKIVDPIVRDNVFCSDPTANVAMLVSGATSIGDIEIVNNYAGPGQFHSAALGGTRLHMVGNHFHGPINFSNAPLAAINNVVNAGASQDHVINGVNGNVVGLGSVSGPDPLGNLMVLWPECPSSAVGEMTT